MKKIKAINKLLNSLTLLSPLTSIGFNNQYQNTQKVITKINNLSNENIKMGDITVTVEGTTITKYVSGEGTLRVASNITKIDDNSFFECTGLKKIDLSNATNLIQIGNNATESESHYGPFEGCTNLTGDLVIPKSLELIGYEAFADCSNLNSINFNNAKSLSIIEGLAFRLCSKVKFIDLRAAVSLSELKTACFAGITNLDYVILPKNLKSIDQSVFNCSSISYLYSGETTVKKFYFLCDNKPTFNTSSCSSWRAMPDIIIDFISVPSEEQKQLYLQDNNFMVSHEEFADLMVINADLPSTNSNTGLILGLVFGLGIPILAGVGFGIWYLTKKKKTIVKI